MSDQNTGDMGSFSVDPSQALSAARSFGIDGSAETDSFGRPAPARTVSGNVSTTDNDAKQPRKRLRRAVADDVDSANDSNRSTPAPSGTQTPSAVLPDQLARIRVESQPGSSASSTHGGPDESSPVQAPRTGRPPTIQDSPGSVIDLRSPEPGQPSNQSTPRQHQAPASMLAGFAGPTNPQMAQASNLQMGVPSATGQQQYQQQSQQYARPTAAMFQHHQGSMSPQAVLQHQQQQQQQQQAQQNYTGGFNGMSPQTNGATPLPQHSNVDHAYQRFSQAMAQWPEEQRLNAWRATNGNERSAMQLLMHQHPPPRAPAVSSPQVMAGQSAYFATAGAPNAMMANRSMAYPNGMPATQQQVQHNPYSYSAPPAGAPRYNTQGQIQRPMPMQQSPQQAMLGQQPMNFPAPQQLQQLPYHQQLQMLAGRVPINEPPPAMRYPAGIASYQAANEAERLRYWHMYLYSSAQNRHPPTQRRPIPQMTRTVQARPAAQHQSSSQGSSQQNQSVLSRSLALAGTSGSSSMKKKKRKAYNSDSEDNDVEYDSAGSGDEYGSVSPAVMARREQVATEFFNEATRDEISELTGCTAAQATMVMKLRPFASANDFRTRTRKQKGVGNNLMDNYLEVVAGMNEVDTLLTECETIGRELATVMRIWLQGAQASSGADGESQASDAGLSLTHISKEMLDRAADPNMHPQVRAAFESYLREQPATMPDGVELKDYQLLGLNWLYLLYRRNTSCILADEMGLGKTVQVIALLSHLKTVGAPGPHIVIVPSSTLENWMREFGVFATNLNVSSYYGSQAERAEIRQEMKESEDLDVVVTTYNIATSSPEDQKFLRKRMKFNVAVFDEGHMLKNSQSKKYRDLMQVRAKWRLLLTGTPLQNNLQELVSLLSFILPDQFRDASDSLRAIFKASPGSHANLLSRERISRAKKMMTPFVLRRKKAQVLKDLPKKIERIEWCDMTDLQKEVYIEALERSKSSLLGAEDGDLAEDVDEDDAAGDDDDKPKKKKGAARVASTKTGNKSDSTSSTNVLMDLRKASCHPMLFRRLFTDDIIRKMSRDCLKELEFQDRNVDYIYEDMEIMNDFELHRFSKNYRYLQKYSLKKDEWMSAGKIQALQRIIPEIRAEGNRLLLFSQFTQVLDILQDVLDTMNVKWLKLTGATSVAERQGLVDEFNEDDSIGVFLLSTRAGGLGLNLTAANYVIFYDQDYNPHNDRQAEDRAYRIGQTKDVTVIKLITRGSLEEDMRELATKKLLLDQNVSGQSNDLSLPASSSSAAAGAKGSDDKDKDKDKGDAKKKAKEETEGEGDQALLEKKVKTSLLSNLKKRFEDEAKGIKKEDAPAAESKPDVKAEAEDEDETKPDVKDEKP